jgi:hypothetical protein
MDIDRRWLLGGTTAATFTGLIGRNTSIIGVGSALAGTDTSTSRNFHPLAQSLLHRAHRIDQDGDQTAIERTIRQYSDASGWTKPLVIKWMDTPTDAHDHLSRLGLDALLDMGSASFWRRAHHPESPDEETFDRAFEARMMANAVLGVGEHDRIMMAPKLLAKSQATSANASDEEVFRVRAVSAQIGWIETSMADAGAEAIANVEALLSAGVSEGSVAIGHQLRIFEAHENGLLATWETPDALICVPRFLA